MSDRKNDLALAFMQSQPGAAAAILEKQPLEYVADFFLNLPHSVTAPVLAKTLPQYSARLCSLLPPTTTADLLSEMDISQIASIMRNSDRKKRMQLLDLLPEQTSIACRLLLNYSEEAVGAWMQVNILTLPDDCSVKDALDMTRLDQQTIDTGAAYIINRDRNLKGVLNLSSMLRSPPKSLVMAVMDRNNNTSIPARTALTSAIRHAAWSQRDYLPVTNRKLQLIGVLRYVDLREGLDQISTTIVQPEAARPISGFTEVYGNSLLTLFNTVSAFAHTKPGTDR